jgi:hypothetical protein
MAVSKWIGFFEANPQKNGERYMDYIRRVLPLSGLETAHRLRTKHAKYYKPYKNRQNQQAVEPEQKPVITFRDDIQTNKHKRHADEVSRKYQEALREVERLSAERDAAVALADFNPSGHIDIEDSSKSEAIAVCVLSDWHIEERVDASKVNGLNEYNLAIAHDRAKQCFRHVLKLLQKEQQSQRISKLIVGVIGDLISGHIHEELMETCQLPPIEASILAEEWIVDGIKFLLKHSNVNIDIVWRVGNHTRITKKVRVSTENGNSLETFMFHHIRNYFRGNGRINFYMANGYLQYTDLFNGGYRICWHHGHAIRYQGGIGGLTIPINKAIAQWEKSKHADLYVMGHWHQFFDGGNFIVNGSMIGYNEYAVWIKAGFEPPKQAFFVISKKWMTKTVTAPILFS